MKKINRKRLNNKGFTLVELLAVVVILALVMGIAATSMLSTMNSSRRNTLHSAAQTAATNLNNWVAEDLLVNDASTHKVGTTFIQATQGSNANKWLCLNALTVYNGNSTSPTSLTTVLGFSTTDIVDSGSEPTLNAAGTQYDAGTCSAVRYNSVIGGYEFILVATENGKYYVASDDTHYAFSRATAANQPLNK